jgi:hypothetical protein
VSQHSSSDPVATPVISGYKDHVKDGEMPQDACYHLKLDRVIESMLRNCHKLDQIEVLMQEKKEREEM